MPHDENYLNKIYGLLEAVMYAFICLDIYVNTLSLEYHNNGWIERINMVLWKFPVLTNTFLSHLILFIWIILIGIAARAKKNLKFNATKHFYIPLAIGFFFFSSSLTIIRYTAGNLQTIAYTITYLVGAICLHTAFQNLTKMLRRKRKQDIWNTEEESFEQNRVRNNDPEIFSIPMQFYHNKRINEGWMNINPFRGIMVIGVPGSGKSESVIVPGIKQFLAKGYSMLVYDFKFPTLAEITYYHYKKHHFPGGALEHHDFHCINLDNIEHSCRINPLLPQYIDTLAKAGETAEAIVSALQKGNAKGGGSEQFFTQSAINFLSAAIYYLAHKENGKYSSIPHLLAFLAQDYEFIFKNLFSMIEIHSLLSPFHSAFKNRAFEQLEGQIGTLRINTSRLATPETFFVFSGNDFNLKISDKKNKSILVLANNIEGQNINSAFFAAVLNRTIALINSKGNNPSAIIVDECPTLYLHKVENLIATARSNKVAVLLGLQELPQFHQQYGKETANTICSLMGSVISGAVRSKETLDWLEKLFGKIKQEGVGFNVDRNRTSVNLNERMDTLIPASKIANQNAGEVVAMVSRDNASEYGKYETNTFKCKVKLDLRQIEEEKKQYVSLPQYYRFGNQDAKKKILLKNMNKIYAEIRQLRV